MVAFRWQNGKNTKRNKAFNRYDLSWQKAIFKIERDFSLRIHRTSYADIHRTS